MNAPSPAADRSRWRRAYRRRSEERPCARPVSSSGLLHGWNLSQEAVGVGSRVLARGDLTDLGSALAGRLRRRVVRDVEFDLFVARGDERFGIAGANAAGVGDMPISWNGFGPDAALLFLLDAPFLTAFSPKKRCPFQLVPVTALATCERLR